MATLLGSGNGTTTLTITLTAGVPAAGTLHVVFAQVSTAGSDGTSQPTSATDTASSTWHVTSTMLQRYPLIGLTRRTNLQVGSVGRACTAGDLSSGDTVTVTFSSANPAAFHTAGLVVYVPATFSAVGTDQGDPDYSNGDISFGSMSALSWAADLGTSFEPTPLTVPAAMLTAMGSYPAQSGFTPITGTLVGEIASGTCSIACAAATVSAIVDPGGSWPSTATELAGNYQFQTGPSGFRAWQRF